MELRRGKSLGSCDEADEDEVERETDNEPRGEDEPSTAVSAGGPSHVADGSRKAKSLDGNGCIYAASSRKLSGSLLLLTTAPLYNRDRPGKGGGVHETDEGTSGARGHGRGEPTGGDEGGEKEGGNDAKEDSAEDKEVEDADTDIDEERQDQSGRTNGLDDWKDSEAADTSLGVKE